MRKCLQKGFMLKAKSFLKENLEEEAFVAPDVTNHMLKLVEPVQQVQQMLLWPVAIIGEWKMGTWILQYQFGHMI